jgi:arginase
VRRRLREGERLSLLRAKCPTCRARTAVAVGTGYECHACGRTFAAGLVRVPRAWGDGGEEMVQAAGLPLDYPEAAVVDEDTLAAQTFAVASDLPARPLVLGGCCCSHVGAVEGLATRHGRIGVIWLDAHGDLNTPASSPSGNEWGMPLRMLIDGGAVAARDVALVGARNLDPPEVEFIAGAGVHGAADAVLEQVDTIYVALDCDVFAPGELSVFMPEPGGPSIADVEHLFGDLRRRATVVGAGLTGLAANPANVEPLERLVRNLFEAPPV